ncbi:MAG: NifB/NifX family molybdenum-iron cluster-binding protein [Thermocladium sp.]|jgi:predicted Fe-Mo cluster-binding NifX family protein|nr:MAG: hypothetical protein AT710_00480 [Thermocladium sp. ECH_B]
MVRIAIATDDDKTISKGHFAHARKYLIYDVDSNGLNRVESRNNPLGNLPDADDPSQVKAYVEQLGIPIHGLSKYEWLRKNVLSDVDAIIASGACQTSFNYFTSEGVQVLFVEPGVSVEDLLSQIVLASDESDSNDVDSRNENWGTDKD